MPQGTFRPLVVLVLALGLVSCAGSSTAPSSSSPPVPQPPAAPATPTLSGVTLFGVVSEMTPTGPAPVAGAQIYCDACGEFGHTGAITDSNGYYSFSGDVAQGGGIWLSPSGLTALLVGKAGYEDPAGLPQSPGMPSGIGWREVMVRGDTRFDITLVRR